MDIHEVARIEINGHTFENIILEYDDKRKETQAVFYSRSGPVAEFKIKGNKKSQKYALVITGQGTSSLESINPEEVKKAFKDIFTKARINTELSENRRAKILNWLGN